MRIVCISDTHGNHRDIHVPECDVLVHAGDIVMDFFEMPSRVLDDFQDFLAWFNEQPARYKLFIGGNHDFGLYFANMRKRYEAMVPEGVIYLRDSEVVIDGVKFYGTPWQPKFGDGAFNIRDHKARLAKMELIPDDTNVLITHVPPKTVMDRLRKSHRDMAWTKSGQKFRHVGCGAIQKQLKRLKELRLHVFGHIHFTHGVKRKDGVVFVNAAQSGSKKPYEIERDAIMVDLLEAGVLVS